MSLKEKIEEVCESEIRKGGFKGNIYVKENVFSIPNHPDYKAQTDFQTKEILFEYTKEVAIKKGEKEVLRVGKDVTAHEINHHGYRGCIGCPQNIEKSYEDFFVPIYKVLQPKGFNIQDIHYLENALEDTILHEDLKINAIKDLEGIVSFFENIGENTQQEKFTPFYEAHVKLNLALWGSKKQKEKLKRFYQNREIVEEVLNGFYSDLANGRFKTKLKKGVEKEFEKFDLEGIRDYFLDEKNWKEISRVYAKHFSRLMTHSYAMPLLDHCGAGTKGREKEDSSQEGNLFQKARESRKFKKEKVMKYYNESNKGKGNGNDEMALPDIKRGEVLELIYEGLAEQIEIRAESPTNPETFPISWYGEREFDPERDTPRHLKFGINKGGEVEIRKKKYSIDMPIRVKTSPKSFPKVKIGIVDMSGSMQEAIEGGDIGNTSIIPWGDNSKYHWAVLTQFSIFEYLKKNHLLSQDSIEMIAFNEDTKVIKGYQNIKEYLLNPPLGGGTHLSLDKTDNLLDGEGNFIYTITDGLITNWEDIRDEFISKVKRNVYVHLHMGTPNEMTRDLEKNGLEVIVAQNKKGIVERVIDLTDKAIK